MQSPENTTIIHSLLQAYCQEFRNWAPYVGPAVYDEALRQRMQQYDTTLHLRIDFTGQGSEVFIPIAYYSLTGDHVFAEAAWERVLADHTTRTLTASRFHELATAYAGKQAQLPFATQPAITSAPAGQSDSYTIEDLIQSLNDEPLLVSLIKGIENVATTPEKTLLWLKRYAGKALPPLLQRLATGTYNFPIVSVHMDENGFPDGCRLLPGAPDEENKYWMHHFLRHFTPLIATAGRYGLGNEQVLLSALYQHIHSYAQQGPLDLLQQLLAQRHIECRGKLFAGEAYTVSYPNPLHLHFQLEQILMPEPGLPVFTRYFPKEDITVSIRPFDHNRDIELVYGWFHAEHAKPIWKMDWPMEQLELFYRTITANETAHSFIGEINGEATFNLEVYWVTRDVLGDYYDVLPDDYGTHLLIAPTDKKKKFPSATMQAILDWLFAEPLIGRLVGEGAVESVAALMNKVHVGFRLDKVLNMPHKRSHLNFCYREWYWQRFPENKNFTPTQPTHKTVLHESTASI